MNFIVRGLRKVHIYLYWTEGSSSVAWKQAVVTFKTFGGFARRFYSVRARAVTNVVMISTDELAWEQP